MDNIAAMLHAEMRSDNRLICNTFIHKLNVPRRAQHRSTTPIMPPYHLVFAPYLAVKRKGRCPVTQEAAGLSPVAPARILNVRLGENFVAAVGYLIKKPLNHLFQSRFALRQAQF